MSDWIKVQDSLEMIFNLLFGHELSLFALAHLRKMKISPLDFADFLWNKMGLILLNRKVSNKDFGIEIRDFIDQTTQSGTAHILFVGNQAHQKFPPLSCKNQSAMVIHPSGTVLNRKGETGNNQRSRYYNDWIACNGQSLVNSTGLCLSTFKLFK